MAGATGKSSRNSNGLTTGKQPQGSQPQKALTWAAHLARSLDVRDPLDEDEIREEPLCLEVVEDRLVRLRLKSGVPEMVRKAYSNGQLCVVLQEPAGASVLVPKSLLPPSEDWEDYGLEDLNPGQSWLVLKVGRGDSGRSGLAMPGPEGAAASMVFALTSAGIAARMVTIFGVELILVQDGSAAEAAQLLMDRSHALFPSSHVQAPLAWSEDHRLEVLGEEESPFKALSGVWTMMHRESPIGTICEDFEEASGPIRLISPKGYFVDLRRSTENDSLLEEGCALGRCRMSSQEDIEGKTKYALLCGASTQPMALKDREEEVEFEGPEQLKVTLEAASEREVWSKQSKGCDDEDLNAGILVLELEEESPQHPSGPRTGLWIFRSGYFARLVGPARGSPNSLVGSTLCSSLELLKQLRTAKDVSAEINNNFEAISGLLKRQGVFTAMVGKGEVTSTSVLWKYRDGRTEKWKILEQTFDPFTNPQAFEPDEVVEIPGEIENGGQEGENDDVLSATTEIGDEEGVDYEDAPMEEETITTSRTAPKSSDVSQAKTAAKSEKKQKHDKTEKIDKDKSKDKAKEAENDGRDSKEKRRE
mmetsp:Transcript_53677/g.117514  ORF Transcript_53677/g.117514 Transcript_53677/m.117514 type:complete len:590 (-) Transcript_53677:10-1779(-)